MGEHWTNVSRRGQGVSSHFEGCETGSAAGMVLEGLWSARDILGLVLYWTVQRLQNGGQGCRYCLAACRRAMAGAATLSFIFAETRRDGSAEIWRIDRDVLGSADASL